MNNDTGKMKRVGNWSENSCGPPGSATLKPNAIHDEVIAKIEKRETVKINEKKKSILLALNARLYPQTVVMRASYRFIDDFDVIVDGDPLSTISVIIRAKKEDDASYSELEELASAFFRELIHANVEETQARRYADTRNALIGAALKSMMPSVTAKEKDYDKQGTPDKATGRCSTC